MQGAAHGAVLLHSVSCAWLGSRVYGEPMADAGQPRPCTPSVSASVQTVLLGGGPVTPLGTAWSRKAGASARPSAKTHFLALRKSFHDHRALW